MIAFFFPIILGAIIGFTLDDGKIDKSDFKHINKAFTKDIKKPFLKRVSRIKKGFAVASK